MPKYSTVLFDVDGTLIHSRPGIVNTFAYAFARMGVDPAGMDLSRYLGPPLRWSFAQHFKTEAEVERAVGYYRERYAQTGMHECSLYPGVEPMLAALKNAGFVLCTATSKPTAVVEPILREKGILPWFDVVGGASMDKSVDTKTAVIRQVLGDARAAGSYVMVGDRQDDLQGAAENKIPAIGVLYGYGSREELLPWHPVALCQTCEELTRTILES